MPIKTDIALGFRCPVCGDIQKHSINAFAIATEGNDVLCDNCNIRYANITRKGRDYLVTVPCGDCGDTHTYKIKGSDFLKPDLKTFACPYTELPSFFVGNAEEVAEAASNAEIDISFMDVDDFADEIEDAIDYLDFLMRSGDICCSCGGRQIDLDISCDTLSLICSECGRRAEFSIATPTDIINLKKIKSIKI